MKGKLMITNVTNVAFTGGKLPNLSKKYKGERYSGIPNFNNP